MGSYHYKPGPIVDVVKNKGRARLKDITEELGCPLYSVGYRNVGFTLSELKKRGVFLKRGRDYLINPEWDGVIPYKKKKAGLYRTKLVSILDKNPMTFDEIKKRWIELGYEDFPQGLSRVLHSAGYADSIGPKNYHGRRVHFLKGQIKLARKKLKELRGVWASETRILDYLKKEGPSPQKNISESLHVKPQNLVDCLRDMRMAGLCEKATITSYYSHSFLDEELFDGISGETYWYILKNPTHIEKLTTVILEAIGNTGDFTIFKKRALSYNLRRMGLPKEIVEKVITALHTQAPVQKKIKHGRLKK